MGIIKDRHSGVTFLEGAKLTYVGMLIRMHSSEAERSLIPQFSKNIDKLTQITRRLDFILEILN
jgi:hypothetical protein